MILTTNVVFAKCMRDLIELRIRDITEELVFGAAVTSIESYRERVGYLRALKDALEMLDEAGEQVEKR